VLISCRGPFLRVAAAAYPRRACRFPGSACPATAWPIQRSRAVRRSSRARSAPAATSIDRTWANVRPGGSVSSALCVMTPPAATAARVRRTAGQRADEPRDTWERGAGALAGEQPGLACHGGCDAAPPVLARRGLVQCPENRFQAEPGLKLRHQGEQVADRVAGTCPSSCRTCAATAPDSIR